MNRFALARMIMIDDFWFSLDNITSFGFHSTLSLDKKNNNTFNNCTRVFFPQCVFSKEKHLNGLIHFEKQLGLISGNYIWYLNSFYHYLVSRREDDLLSRKMTAKEEKHKYQICFQKMPWSNYKYLREYKYPA